MGNSAKDPLQELIYGLSHDLGAPLRSVARFSELLQQKLDDRLSDKERYWLQLVHEGGVQAQAMVEGLLQYSRLHSRMEEPQEIDLNELLTSVVNDQTLRYKKRQPISTIEPDIKINIASSKITGVYNHWYLYFSSVLENALLFQPKDNELHQPVVEILCEENSGKFIFTVEDNGIGATDEQLPQLTRPFKRVFSEQEYPGIGMGLAYCERIAQLSGGELTITHSKLGGLAVIYSN